jgi:hypothetical protein
MMYWTAFGRKQILSWNLCEVTEESHKNPLSGYPVFWPRFGVDISQIEV